MSFKSILKSLGFRQNAKPEVIALSIDVSAVVNGTNTGVLEGANYVTVTKNGTGDFTITLNEAGRRACIFLGGGVIGQGFLRLNNVSTTSAVRVVVESDAGTNSDLDFECAILVLRSATQR